MERHRLAPCLAYPDGCGAVHAALTGARESRKTRWHRIRFPVVAADQTTDGSCWQLPRLIGLSNTLLLQFTGDAVDGTEAYRLGLVNEVCTPAGLMGRALEIAEKIARNSPTAVQSVKHAVKGGQGETLEQAVAIMMEAHWASVVHPDRLEGIRAFNQGREPQFLDPDR